MATMQARRIPRGCAVSLLLPPRMRHCASLALDSSRTRQAGYTLIEAIGTLMVLALLTSLAINSFAGYAKRARAADALEQLDLYRTRMEKGFLDNGNYGIGNCAVPPPTIVDQFAFTCTLTPDGQAYTAKATGSVGMTGYVFQVDEKGLRTTQAFPAATVPANCWMVERNKCQ